MVSITLSRLDILVSEQFGYLIEIVSTLRQVSSKGVPQSMIRKDLNPCLTHCNHKCPSKVMLVDLCSTLTVENNIALDTYNHGLTLQDTKSNF
ncbi:hypothetical protein [Candidatus Scalindua japonica]|uniref:hypothetical protein n=1 Tax=Candidatus Scalindua japonica TaxID=1284222 RepID=UPI00193DCBFE|nr:hypothetical protein [Candidatus Scalindua japonica]